MREAVALLSPWKVATGTAHNPHLTKGPAMHDTDNTQPSATTETLENGITLSLEDGRDSLGTYYACGILTDADGTELYRTATDDWYRTQGRCVRWLCDFLNAHEGA
jgi:hypothetical protein